MFGRQEITPHPGKQTEFLQCTDDIVFFGGARGGSKSFSLALKCATQSREYHFEYDGKRITRREYDLLLTAGKEPTAVIDKISIDYPEFIGILIRRTFPMLERNLKRETDKIYKHLGGKWQERNKCYVFPSGAKIYLVHCKDRKALDNYIGGNYNFIGIDEANQFPWDWIEELWTASRTDDERLPAQMCLTSNPGNISHLALKIHFVDLCIPTPDGPPIYNEEFDVTWQPYKSGPAYFDDEGISWKYIPSLVFENPSIMLHDKTYVKKLKSLNPILRAMWLEGRWDVFQGAFFDMWSELHHTINQEEFTLDLNTQKIFRAYDYGTKKNFVCLFVAMMPSGKLIVFDEIVQEGLSASKQAKKVNRYAWKKYKLQPSDFEDEICDPAYFTKAGEKEGELYSPADWYEDEGIILSPGANDRLAGAKVVYEALTIPDIESDGDYKPPYIRFTDNCEYMIQTLPTLPADDGKHKGEDVDTDGEDHGYDALRYLCMEVLDPEGIAKEEEKGWRYEQSDYHINAKKERDAIIDSPRPRSYLTR